MRPAALQPLFLALLGLVASVQASSGSTLQTLNPRYSTLPLDRRDLPTGTCNKDTPCVNGACCGSDGLCGYSPKSCAAGCQHNCDAKAECGEFAPKEKAKCPLNVCCSEFGFCGSTQEFCGGKKCDTKWGGCGEPNRPSCGGGNSIGKRTIGYYESWAATRKCQVVQPEDLNLNGFTHINFAFAFFDPKSLEIAPMDEDSGKLFSRFTALKQTAQGLQAWISVGGWSFTDPGPTRTAFSDMASSSDSRKKFIDNLMKFMSTYNFDGVDLDWEYPGADDRGGKKEDTANYVSLMKEMRAAFGSKYGISVTLPTSFWYLQHFDLPGIQDSIDWFNLMSYDLHGTWDAQSKFMGPYLGAHTNVTEIDLGLDLLWRAGVKSEKVVLGKGWYGRSFTLKDPKCNKPDGSCQFDAGVNGGDGIGPGGAKAGPCSNAAGILSYQEIQDVIKKTGVKPEVDEKAAVKWITWDDNQWVSYDDDDTFKMKNEFANKRCLGGTMVWAMDQKDQKESNGLGPAPNVTPQQHADAKQQMQDHQAANDICYTAGCGDKCKKGYDGATQMSGQPGDLSTMDRCTKKGQHQTLCCKHGTTMGQCQWRGWRGVGLPCTSGCADGETEVAKNTNNKDGKNDQSCTGGLQSYCCQGFSPPPSKEEKKKSAEDQAQDAAKDAAIGVGENIALDIAAKAFCRIAIPALLAPLEAIEAAIPIIGEIADIAEIAATPALIIGCEKGIEKAGKAEFKVFGKTHKLEMPGSPAKKPDDAPPPKPDDKKPDDKKPDDDKPDDCKRDGEGSNACTLPDAPGGKGTRESNPPSYQGKINRPQNEHDMPEKKSCGPNSYSREDMVKAMTQGMKYFKSPRPKANKKDPGVTKEGISWQTAGDNKYPHNFEGREVDGGSVNLLKDQYGNAEKPCVRARANKQLMEFPIMAGGGVFQGKTNDKDKNKQNLNPPEDDRVLFAPGDETDPDSPFFCGMMTHSGAASEGGFVDCK